MARTEVEKMLAEWKSGYERLSAISMEQLMLLKNHIDDSQVWEQLQRLTDERVGWQSRLEAVQHQAGLELGEGELKRLFREQIRSLAESARVLTFEATRKIEEKMLSTGSELTATKTQRKVFNAYTGIHTDDQMAYYIDQRK